MRNRTRSSLQTKTVISLVIWGLAAMLFATKVFAQYTGAKPYTQQFGWPEHHLDDGELRLTNESEYPMVVAIQTLGERVVDHAFIGAYQTHTFTGIKEGRYKYKAEVRDGGNAYEYIEGKGIFEIVSNVCPPGYNCSGRNYMSIKIYYSISYYDGNRPKNITKQQFFN